MIGLTASTVYGSALANFSATARAPAYTDALRFTQLFGHWHRHLNSVPATSVLFTAGGSHVCGTNTGGGACLPVATGTF